MLLVALVGVKILGLLVVKGPPSGRIVWIGLGEIMASELHDAQSVIGAKWLKRQGFSVVATELSALGCREQADVIGFRSQCSVVIESKVSRADFLVDQKKPHRTDAGIGLYRFYICPPGMIRVDELPARWGLLYADGKKVIEVVRPQGNIWPGSGTTIGNWGQFQHSPDLVAERNVLFSISRRLVAGKSVLRAE